MVSGFEAVPQTIRNPESFLHVIKRFASLVEPIIGEAGKNVKMEMPDVLVTRRTIVLSRRDALTSKRIPHGIRDAAGCAKEIITEIVRDV
jgi:hypothetical protein